MDPHNTQSKALKCPRCDSLDTKFCYYNNYNYSQPRHLCKSCRRYWTLGGLLRNVPVGGGSRKSKTSKSNNESPSPSPSPSAAADGGDWRAEKRARGEREGMVDGRNGHCNCGIEEKQTEFCFYCRLKREITLYT